MVWLDPRWGRVGRAEMFGITGRALTWESEVCLNPDSGSLFPLEWGVWRGETQHLGCDTCLLKLLSEFANEMKWYPLHVVRVCEAKSVTTRQNEPVSHTFG